MSDARKVRRRSAASSRAARPEIPRELRAQINQAIADADAAHKLVVQRMIEILLRREVSSRCLLRLAAAHGRLTTALSNSRTRARPRAES